MLCQKCQQNPATVFFSQTVGNQTTQLHLCEACAKEQSQAYGGLIPFGFNPFSTLTEFLNQFMPWGDSGTGESAGVEQSGLNPEQQLQCPHCGYLLSTFRQTGRLGCTQCYESFRQVLEPLVSGIHGNVRHQEEAAVTASTEGTVTADPAAAPISRAATIEDLKEKMKQAIAKEKFEEAARLRDEIHKLEGA